MRTCFFIPSYILFAEQMSIERNNSVVVIFRHLLPLLPNLYFISCLSLIFLYVMFSLLFFMSCSGLFSLQSPSGFFSMSCSGLTRTSMDPRNALRLPEDDNENTRHLLTICTQKATRFNKNSRRSRCCGQAGYSLQDNEKNAVLFHKSRRVFKINKVYQTFRP